jgi:tRNA-dihydrouridine synthase A
MLYTDMIHTNAILNGNAHRALHYNACEHPVALQLGGNDPYQMKRCASIIADYGYDEINLNIGCPSSRVSEGGFGLYLMTEPMRVARCIEAIKSTTDLPVTVKCRTGVDAYDHYSFLKKFIDHIYNAGCDFVFIHARKGWLQGLSPKQNRSIPALNYTFVRSIKHDFANLPIGINGGIITLDQAESLLNTYDAVMIGRQAYHDPFMLAQIDTRFNKAYSDPTSSPLEVAEIMLEYVDTCLKEGTKLHHITKHMLNLFQGWPGARKYRRYISENAHQKDAGSHTIKQALKYIQSNN